MYSPQSLMFTQLSASGYVCKTGGMICFIVPNRNGSDAGERSIWERNYQQAIANPVLMQS